MEFQTLQCGRNILAVTKFIILLKVEFDELLKAGLLNCPFVAFSVTPAMNAFITKAVFIFTKM